MDTSASKSLFLFLLSILIVCSTGSFLFPIKRGVKSTDKQTTHNTSHRELVQTTQHNFMNPPVTTYPNTPVTNPVTTPNPNPTPTPNPTPPVTFPPDTSTPGIVTVPSANPVTVPPTPVTFPPVTNPVTTPSTTIPGGQPVTNPVTTYPNPTGGIPATNPVVPPPVITNAPVVPGQSWCVARSGLPDTAIQAALDYACGIGGADCSAIQQGASCYNPNSLQNHASYAFNSYYQRNPVQTSCDFGGTAMITNVNPSSGSCIFPTWSPSSTSPTTATNPMPTPSTESSSGATPTPTSSGSTPTPTVVNATNPALGGSITGNGEIPPTGSTSSVSMSTSLRPLFHCIVVVTSMIITRIVLDI